MIRSTRYGLWGILLLFSFLVLSKGILPALKDSGGDFANYYTASRIVREGRSIEPAYRDFSWFQKQMDREGFERQVGGFIPHPPSTALLFLPLTFLDPLTAKRAWTLLNLVFALLIILLLTKLSGLNWLLAAILFMSSGAALINNLLFGQLYLLLLLSILLGLYLLRSGYPVAAGLCLGALLPIKYVALPWIALLLWQRQWKVLLGAAGATLALLLLTLWAQGPQPFDTFLNEVLPRHLRGEIQDPFSTRFQSFNSLFRRLFLAEPTLNPKAALDAPFLLFLFKNLTFWMLAGVTGLVLAGTRFSSESHRFLFRMGLLPVIVLLLSPGGATYHFLLLCITAVFYVRILLDLGRARAATAVAAWLVLVNLPHYLRLEWLAQGWWTPAAYSRLWLLLLFLLASLWIFRHSIRLRSNHLTTAGIIIPLVVGLTTLAEYTAYARRPQDNAQWLEVEGPELSRNLGLILDSPDLGRRELVFSYCELMDERYAIYGADGSRWTPPGLGNYYEPDLAWDDQRLLAETVISGKAWISLSPGRGQPPRSLVEGENPSWIPDGSGFVFERGGGVHSHRMRDLRTEQLLTGSSFRDALFSPQGNRLAYCADGEEGTILGILDLETKEERTMLSSSDRIEAPGWSPDGEKIVFCWNRAGNRDIWVIDTQTQETRQLTFHLGADAEPVWDGINGRILFTSDRGRGLGFSTLYWLPAPE